MTTGGGHPTDGSGVDEPDAGPQTPSGVSSATEADLERCKNGMHLLGSLPNCLVCGERLLP